MTALAAAGTVDCSGLVGSILQRFRSVGARDAQEVAGDPAAVRAASQQHAQQAQQLATTSQQARQRSTGLAADWEGGAYDAYAAKTDRICTQLDDAATTLQTHARALGQAAAANENATRRMTALLADYDGKADRLIAEAHTAAPGAVNAFVSAANRLGQSLVDEGDRVREDLSRTLDVLAGNDPTKPEETEGDPKIGLWKKDTKYGIDKALSTEDLDALMGGKPEPTSALGRLASKTSVTLWKPEGDGTLFSWGLGDEGHVRTDLPGGGAAGASGSWFLGPKGTATGKLGVDDGDLKGEASARVTLADVKGDAYATIGPATVQASGEGYVGADADVNGTIGLHGGSLHAGAFAGGKVEGSLSGDVGGVNAGVTGSLRYGVGADLDAKATWDHGHLQLGFQAGAALGGGASVGGHVDIDLAKVWDDYEHVDPAGAQVLRDGATWVGNTASEASHAIGDALERLGR